MYHIHHLHQACEYQLCSSALEVQRSIICNTHSPVLYPPQGSSVESKDNMSFVHSLLLISSVTFVMFLNPSFHVCNIEIIVVFIHVHESHI